MTALRRDFVPADAIGVMQTANVDAAVAVQARQTLEETAWLLSLADQHPFIRGVVGWVDLQDPAVSEVLDRLCDHPRLIGVRHIVQDEADGFLDRPAFLRGIALLERYGLTYDILVHARQLPAALRFAQKFPRQRFILDHLGKPEVARGEFEEWRGHFDRLATLPNVCCKMSGLVTEADWTAWTPGHLRPYLDAALEAFGPARLVIGSDWPVCTLAGDYAGVIGATIEAIQEYSTAEQELMLGGTAQRIWPRLTTARGAAEANTPLPNERHM
jgi:L-fuconolactonase